MPPTHLSKKKTTYTFSTHKIPTSLTYIEDAGLNRNVSTNSRDLIVMVPDESDMDNHMDIYIEWFNQRKRTNKEYWLLDITFLNRERNEKLQKLKLDLDDDVFWFAFSTRGIELYEVYRIHKDFDIKIIPFGFWTIKNGLSVPSNGKWQRRKNMEGVNINVVTELAEPYTTQMIPKGSGKFDVKGMCADILFSLQSILNFTVDGVTKSPDGQWGTLKSDGTWTGMVRELQDERMDIGLSGFAISSARATVIDYSTTINEDFSTLFIKNPSGTFNFMAYVVPLRHMSWFFVGLFTLVAPISLFFTARLGHEPMKDEFTWGKSQIFVLGSLTMRGWKVTPNKYSCRCAFIV